jgi:hypothetical protein
MTRAGWGISGSDPRVQAKCREKKKKKKKKKKKRKE